MLYAAKCYWPGVTQTQVEQVAARAPEAGSTLSEATYLGALLFSHDDLVLCLFDGPSRAAVKRASERADIPCERLMDYSWVEGERPNPKGAMQ